MILEIYLFSGQPNSDFLTFIVFCVIYEELGCWFRLMAEMKGGLL